MAFDLQNALATARPGASIPVPAGRYLVNLLVEQPVTLVAMGPVVLDACGLGSAVRINCTQGTVRLSGLLLAGGDSAEGGGGVAVTAGTVELTDCTFRYNHAPLNGGGGLWLTGDAQVTATRCRFEGNTGRQGGAVLVDQVARLRLLDSVLVQNAAVDGGAVRVREGGQLEVSGCTFGDNKVVGTSGVVPTGSALSVGGTSSRAPVVSLSHCVVGERDQSATCLHLGAEHPGSLSVVRCLLPPSCAALGGENLFGPPGFLMRGSEPYQLTPDSAGVCAGLPTGFPADAKDAVGRARYDGQVAPELGAFALVR